MIKKGILFGILLLFLISFVSAGIRIDQPNSLYNLGEEMEIKVSVDQFQAGYFDVDLVCGSNSENIYHGIIDKQTIIMKRELVPLYIGNLSGTCQIEVDYGGNSKVSQKFKISKHIIVDLDDVEKINITAGETLKVEGTATKENGELLGLNGDRESFAELKIEDEIKASGVINNGRFELEFQTPETMRANNYNLVVWVYDKDDRGNRLNIGDARIDLEVEQVPASLDLAIDKKTITPGEDLTIIISLLDRAGDKMQKNVLVRIEDSEEREIYSEMKSTEQKIVFTLETTHAAGQSIISIEKDDLRTERFFEVNELEKIDIEIKNNTLFITNVGNVLYDKPVEVEIGDKVVEIDLKLKSGQKNIYELSAPDGNYDIKVGNLFQKQGVALTGHAIDINQIGGTISVWLKYPLVWIFLVILIGLVIFVMYKNHQKKKSYATPIEKPKLKLEQEQAIKEEKEKIDKIELKEDKQENKISTLIGGLFHKGKEGEKTEKVIDQTQTKTVTKGEHVLVLNGQKQNAGIIAIKINNALTQTSKANLIEILKEAYEEKGISSVVGQYVVLVFSPLLSKTFKNEEAAVKVAQNIDAKLKEHNRKFKDKIEYGIGVNAGEIINKIEAGKLKFTSIGVTLINAKKIADLSVQAGGEILVGKAAHEKTMSNVKVEKSPLSKEIEVFTIKRVVDEERNKQFIQDFIRRESSKS